MRKLRAVVFLFALFCSAGAASAAQAPSPGVTDARIQTIEYDPDQVVLLRGVLNYQLMLEFGPGERLENVSIGDSTSWQVTPNRKSDLLFLKPMALKPNTNMTVVTNMRRYAFELHISSKTPDTSKIPFIVRFVYPLAAAAEPLLTAPDASPIVANKSYRVTGASESSPVSVFDDGKATYFTWAPDAAIPAIFAVSADGSESLVNYAVRGDFTVVQQIAPRFVLRNGKQTAVVTNGKSRRQPLKAVPGGGVHGDRN